jgi:hypothetical protein
MTEFEQALAKCRGPLTMSVAGDYNGPALVRSGVKTETRRMSLPKYRPGDLVYIAEPLRKADTETITYASDGALADRFMRWRWKRDSLSARFMPKDLARTVVEIVGVRRQPLCDVTDEDAIKEGVRSVALTNGGIAYSWTPTGTLFGLRHEAFYAAIEWVHRKPLAKIGNPEMTAYEFRVVARKEG